MANRRIRTVWSDLNGLTHGRYIPAAKLEAPTPTTRSRRWR